MLQLFESLLLSQCYRHVDAQLNIKEAALHSIDY